MVAHRWQMMEGRSVTPSIFFEPIPMVSDVGEEKMSGRV